MDPQQRFGAIQAPGIVGHESTWMPMGSAQTCVMRLPEDYNQVARDALAHRPITARGSRRRLRRDWHPSGAVRRGFRRGATSQDDCDDGNQREGQAREVVTLHASFQCIDSLSQSSSAGSSWITTQGKDLCVRTRAASRAIVKVFAQCAPSFRAEQ